MMMLITMTDDLKACDNYDAIIMSTLIFVRLARPLGKNSIAAPYLAGVFSANHDDWCISEFHFTSQSSTESAKLWAKDSPKATRSDPSKLVHPRRGTGD